MNTMKNDIYDTMRDRLQQMINQLAQGYCNLFVDNYRRIYQKLTKLYGSKTSANCDNDMITILKIEEVFLSLEYMANKVLQLIQ